MGWLMLAVIIVMLVGLIATLIIGQSQSNKREDPSYSQHTRAKWIRLISIYVGGIAVVAAIWMVLDL